MADMLATPANMAKLAQGLKVRGDVFAYSPRTLERYSADPGDYFMAGIDQPLLDSEGEPMVLAYSYEKVVIVEE